MSLKSVRKAKAGEFLNWMGILLIVVSEEINGTILKMFQSAMIAAGQCCHGYD